MSSARFLVGNVVVTRFDMPDDGCVRAREEGGGGKGREGVCGCTGRCGRCAHRREVWPASQKFRGIQAFLGNSLPYSLPRYAFLKSTVALGGVGATGACNAREGIA